MLEALREGLRCRELWVAGANKYRNPDDDLPKDFEEKRMEYYEALGQPNEAKAFADALQQQMIAALSSFDRALPKLAPKVRILEKNGGWISCLAPGSPGRTAETHANSRRKSTGAGA